MHPDRMWQRVALVAVISLVLAGCAAKPAVVSTSGRAQHAADVQVQAASAKPGYAGASTTDGLVSTTDRMIVQTVEMTIVVEDTEAAMAAISQSVAEGKGYIAESSRWMSNEQTYGRVVFRVPAAALGDVVAAVQRTALRVDNQSTRGEDVTEEYVDLDARLRNLEATEAELLALMTEIRENRGKAEDVLAIYREITGIRQQIESLKGRQQYLSRMSAMATVNVDIRPKEAPRQVVVKAQWSPVVTASKALRGFVDAFKVLVDILIYVLIFGPFVLAPVAVIWLIARQAKRARAKRSGAVAAAGDDKVSPGATQL